jgi:hypothetical protein
MKKQWYVGAMPAGNGGVHPDVFQSDRHFAEGQPWGGYAAVFGPYASKAAAATAGKRVTAGLRGNRRRNPISNVGNIIALIEQAKDVISAQAGYEIDKDLTFRREHLTKAEVSKLAAATKHLQTAFNALSAAQKKLA